MSDDEYDEAVPDAGVYETSSDDIFLGCVRKGVILVGWGEDGMIQAIDWLESLISDFDTLNTKAEELGVELIEPASKSTIYSPVDFCDAIGISISRSYIERIAASGYGHWRPLGKMNFPKSMAPVMDTLRAIHEWAETQAGTATGQGMVEASQNKGDSHGSLG
jgi:hypothetical protein